MEISKIVYKDMETSRVQSKGPDPRLACTRFGPNTAQVDSPGLSKETLGLFYLAAQ